MLNENERKICIGLYGLTKVGKDHVADIFSSDEFGAFHIYNLTERVLKPIGSVRGLELSRDNLRLLLTKLDNNANEILFTHVRIDGYQRIILPNIRLLSSIDFWRNKSGYEFYLCYVSAKDEIRYSRYVQMNRDIDPQIKSIEELKQMIDFKDLYVNELDQIMKIKYDVELKNNDDTNYLKQQINNFIKNVIKLK